MKDQSILTNAGIDVNKALELFGDMETYDQMLEEFLVEAPNKINNARKFKEQADMANYAIVVHSLKSDCKYFGIFDLADKFYQHELAGKSNDFYFVTENFDSLIVEANKYINLLKRYMGVSVDVQETIEVSKASETILVVDDSNLIRTFIQKIFGNKYNVEIARDGEEALNIITSHGVNKFACMFLDLNMPNVNGFQVLDYFRQNELFDKIPVSIITGISDEETMQKLKNYPIVSILSKPFNELTIKEAANKALSYKK